MPAPRSRVVLTLLGLLLAMGLSTAVPTAGAENPVAAVDALVERVRNGQFDALDEIVCASEQDAVRAQFDVAGELGATTGLAGDEFADAFSIILDGVSTDLLNEDGDAAIVRLQGQMTISMERSAAEAFVLASIGAFGEEINQDELATLVDSVLQSFTQAQTLDEEVKVARENGEWLVCDSLAQTTSDAAPIDDGSSLGSQVSFDGLCGLITLDEVNATGPLVYDSSIGFDDSCSYSNSSPGVFYTLAATVDRSSGIDVFTSIYPEYQDVTVAGQPGLLSDDALFAGLDSGSTLVATLFIDDGGAATPASDRRAHLLAFAELLAPVIPAQARDSTTDTSTGLLGGQLPLCEALSLDRLNGLGEVEFDLVEGDGEFCTYSSTDFQDGFSLVTLSLDTQSGLVEFVQFLPGGEELMLGTNSAYLFEEQLFVQTDQGLLSIGAFATDALGESVIDARSYSSAIAMAVLETLGDLTPGEADSVSITAEGSLCDLLSLDAINTLGPLQYDDVFDGGSDLCVYSATQPDQGFHTLSLFTEFFALEELVSVYEGGVSAEIGGLPTYGQGETLWIDMGERVLAISPLLDDADVDLGTDAIGFASQVARLVAEAAAAEG